MKRTNNLLTIYSSVATTGNLVLLDYSMTCSGNALQRTDYLVLRSSGGNRTIVKHRFIYIMILKILAIILLIFMSYEILDNTNTTEKEWHIPFFVFILLTGSILYVINY